MAVFEWRMWLWWRRERQIRGSEFHKLLNDGDWLVGLVESGGQAEMAGYSLEV